MIVMLEQVGKRFGCCSPAGAAQGSSQVADNVPAGIAQAGHYRAQIDSGNLSNHIHQDASAPRFLLDSQSIEYSGAGPNRQRLQELNSTRCIFSGHDVEDLIGNQLPIGLIDQTRIENYKGTKLIPEKNTSTEIGLHFEHHKSDRSDPFSELGIHAAWFKNNYLGKIIEFPVPRAPPIPINTGKSTTTGWDFQADIGVLRDLLSISLGALFLDIENKRVFQFKPDVKAVATVTLTISSFQLSSTVFHEGEQTAFFWSPGEWDVSEFTLKPRTDIDLHLRRKVSLGHLDAEASLSGLNLRNSGADSPAGRFYYMGDRQWYASLAVAI